MRYDFEWDIRKARSNVHMKKEYDFSKGVRGKFYNADAEFNLPIYLEPEIAEFVQKLAVEKNVDRSQIVNLLLKKDKEIIEL
jgi:S-adenosylmethionine:diacylglycerol 3-amino-3-carboxypropyl transferase